MIFRALGRNLVAGARLALFLPVRAADYRATAPDYAALLAFNFLLWVGSAWLSSGGGEFDPMAVPIYLASIPVVLATAMLVAVAIGAPGQGLLVAVALTASDFVFEVAAVVLVFVAADFGPLAGFALILWLWVTAMRAVRACGGTRPWPFIKGAALVGAMLLAGLTVFPRSDVWLQPEEAPAPEALASEELFHRQGRLVEEALAAIQPGRAGTPELYFVGFAPDASQDVFLRDMRFAKRQFDGRFGTAGRSIALASSVDALAEFPVGSATNLARALLRVGAAMNPDEDVLFLYLTAHGDRQHRLSAWQPPLDLAPLTPTALARMLQETAVRWRVIVVSACFSGGYLEPLRDDNTIVITASAADRESFGCEAGSDATWFGEAYFREALEANRSFTEAFLAAQSRIEKRERDAGHKPSQPQMWVGPAIARHLRDNPGLLENRQR